MLETNLKLRLKIQTGIQEKNEVSLYSRDAEASRNIIWGGGF